MAERGITGDVADELYVKMKAFANYGFPESHSVSFAYLVYASSWIKYHEPAAFCAALLNAQPMGFWSPHTLVRDARRHGVVVRTPDLNASLAKATLEPLSSECLRRIGGFDPAESSLTLGRRQTLGWTGPQPAVRLGIGSVRGIGEELAEADRGRAGRAAGRTAIRRTSCGGSRRSTWPSSRRWPPAGCSASASGCQRREALWAVGAVAQSRPDRLAGVVTGARRPTRCRGCPRSRRPSPTCGPPASRPTVTRRASCATELDALGVVTSQGLWDVTPGSRVTVAGVVTHRQRPMTAQGTTFLNLEDETGLINVVVSKGCWARFRRVAREAPAMTIRGRLERAEGVINLVAEHLEPLTLPGSTIHASRDFR